MRLANLLTASAVSIVALSAAAAASNVRITEFMSEGQGDQQSGNGGRRQREFFEITNLGNAAEDVSGWSYNDDNPNDPLNFGPSIGSIAAHESIVFTQMTAADFRTYWGLSNSVRVYSIGGLSNLGNADTINIYSSFTQNASTLVDSLSYLADARGSGVSRNRPWDGGAGQYANTQWVISGVGDNYGSFLAPSPTGFPPNFPAGGNWNQADYIDLGNPGSYIPAPGAAVLIGLAGMIAMRRRRN